MYHIGIFRTLALKMPATVDDGKTGFCESEMLKVLYVKSDSMHSNVSNSFFVLWIAISVPQNQTLSMSTVPMNCVLLSCVSENGFAPENEIIFMVNLFEIIL